jgi:hypothetical protein
MRLSAHGSVATQSLIQHLFLIFKGASQLAKNAHILTCMLRFFATLRLALSANPQF